MDGLTKENFFDEMSKLYPVAMKDFNDFIDGYKKQINWDDIFNGTCYASSGDADQDFQVGSPKFHEIPYEMQLGILLKYMCERVPKEAVDLLNDFFTTELVQTFKETLDYLNDKENGKLD